MIQINLLGLHEFRLVLLYNEPSMRTPTNFRLSVLQSKGIILLIRKHYGKHITCTNKDVGIFVLNSCCLKEGKFREAFQSAVIRT
jgi:hypothetical protein